MRSSSSTKRVFHIETSYQRLHIPLSNEPSVTIHMIAELSPWLKFSGVISYDLCGGNFYSVIDEGLGAPIVVTETVAFMAAPRIFRPSMIAFMPGRLLGWRDA